MNEKDIYININSFSRKFYPKLLTNEEYSKQFIFRWQQHEKC